MMLGRGLLSNEVVVMEADAVAGVGVDKRGAMMTR